MVVYNHAPYVGEAIASVLRQTFSDFAFLILDNGSTDASLSVIGSFDDPRISVRVLPENVQSTSAANMLLRQAEGRYVALLCSDDAWHPEKLERQVAWMEGHPACGAVFTRVQSIDRHGRPNRLPTMYDCHFNIPRNRDRLAWLRYLHTFRNPFCCSSALLRTSALEQCGPYDERSCNIQDLIQWAKLLFCHDVQVIEEKLTSMRYYRAASNLSAVSAANMIRTDNEAALFYAAFWERITSPALFEKLFPEAPARLKHLAEKEPELAVVLHMLSAPPNIMARTLALGRLYALMSTRENRERCNNACGLSLLDLYACAAATDTYGRKGHGLLGGLRSAAKALLRPTGLLPAVKYIRMKWGEAA
jgi:glycosyltransferase involved in cell wall biosynthesis